MGLGAWDYEGTWICAGVRLAGAAATTLLARFGDGRHL